MAVSDDDGTAERLAQVRAEQRHVRRLRAAERRDAAHEAAAARVAERETERAVEQDSLASPPVSADDARSLLIAEAAALELEREALIVDREVDDGVEI